MKINVALISNDGFLSRFLKNLENIDLDIFKKNNIDIDYYKYSIIILDLLEQENVLKIANNINLYFCLIININSFKINNTINIEVPFKINALEDQIINFINYIKKYIIIDNSFKLNINKNILFIENKNIQLTEKECLLIETLYKNKQITKDDLLKVVCGYDNNSKAIETLIYNIRFKLKNNDIENFLICQDGFYKLNLTQS